MRPATRRTPGRQTAVAVAKRPSVAARTASGSGARAATAVPARTESRMKLAVPLAISGVVLLAAAVILMSSGNAKKTANGGSGDSKSGADSGVAMNSQPTPTAPFAKSGPSPQTVAAPAESKPQELSFGTRTLPPDTRAPAVPPAIPSPAPVRPFATPHRNEPTATTFGPWVDLFDGKTMQGWQGFKGKWDAVDGFLTAVDSTQKGAMIQTTDESFGNFELKCQVWGDKSPFVEAHIRSYGVVYTFDMEQRKWHDMTINANGDVLRATLDGVEVPKTDEGESGLSVGFISFYIHKDGVMKVKDLKVRKILPK
jgi:hypothetical protein